MSRLEQLDIIRAWHHHHYDAAVFALLDRTSERRSFRPQLSNRGFDVPAHQCNQMVTRAIVALALPLAVRRMYAHLNVWIKVIIS